MNILVTINQKYLPYFATMITSLAANNAGTHQVYIISNDVTMEDLAAYRQAGKIPAQCTCQIFPFDENLLGQRPRTNVWSIEIYFKLFAHQILPDDVDKVLFLDADIIVKDDISDLYDMPFENHLFIAATHIHSKIWRRIVNCYIGAKRDSVYLNCGVIMMNLAQMRQDISIDTVFGYIKKHRKRLAFPEQDIITALYGDRIKTVDPVIYNFNDRYFRWFRQCLIRQKITPSLVADKVKIIHYIGKNKPWLPNYRGKLKHYWQQYDSTL